MDEKSYPLDDKRVSPLLHAMVQKTDFTFELEPVVPNRSKLVFEKRSRTGGENYFRVVVVSAIGQPIPGVARIWSRQHLVLFKDRSSAKRQLSLLPTPEVDGDDESEENA